MIAAELKKPQPAFDLQIMREKMKVKFPNAGVSHQEKVEAGAAVLGDTAAAFAQQIIRLMEIQISVLNNIYTSNKISETVLSSGKASSVIHAIRTLESKKKKQKVPVPVVDCEAERDDEDAETVDDDSNKENVPSEYDVEDEHENIDNDVSLLSLHSSPFRRPLASSRLTDPRPMHSSSSSPSIFSSSSPVSSSSSTQSPFSSRPLQSMQVEASKVPEKLKKGGKAAATKKRKV